MPSKNSLKELVEGGYFHVYNRGVAKQNIFLHEKDYVVFLRFLKEYLLAPDHPDLQQLEKLNPRRTPKNCFADIELLAYCLMPNHFHLLLKNLTERGIEKLMRVLGTSYSLYFNKAYERVGPLYQGVYKAVSIKDDDQFVHVSRYIHMNPRKLLAKDSPLQTYPYSSYPNYLGQRTQDWVKPKEILSFFSNIFPNLSYHSFTEERELQFQEFEPLLFDFKDSNDH